MSTQVNGKAFLGMIHQLKQSGGQSLLQSVISNPSLQPVFASKIRKGDWLPYQAYIDLLSAVDQKLGSGDGSYCYTIGTKAGQVDLNTFYKIYRLLANPEQLIRACTTVWRAYYRNAGTMETISTSADNTVVRIVGFPQMHRHHCLLMQGWMVSTLDVLGFEAKDVEESRCNSRGDDCHEYTCSWTKK